MRFFFYLMAVAMIALFLTNRAEAGDQDPLLFGEQASITGGALSAVTDEAEAVWYNPAGLAAIQRSRVSLSGGNLLLRFHSRPGMLQANLPTGETLSGDGEDTSFGYLPVGIGFSHSLSDRLTVAGMVFLRDRSELDLVTSLDLSPVLLDGLEVPNRRSRLSVYELYRNVSFGSGLGWQATPNVRVGIGLYGVMNLRTTRISLLHDNEPIDTLTEGVHIEARNNSAAIQGFAVFGVQWRLSEHWRLGLVWRTSEILLVIMDEVPSREAMIEMEPVVGSAVASRVERREAGDGALEIVAPPLARIALAYQTPRGWIDVEAEISPPHRDPGRGQNQKTLWNVRIGGQLAITETITLGGGLFTANSSLEQPAGVLYPAINFYGITLGMQFRRYHRVPSRDEPLVFSTSIGSRYAIGIGRTIGLSFDPTSPSSGIGSGETTDIMVHEISLLFGTGILF